jgi:hypothetical protein
MIKQPVFAGIAGVLFLIFAGYVINRLIFINNSERTTGIVENITGSNSRCRSGRKSRHNCTKFNATIRFNPLNESKEYRLELSAGSSRGHNQPISDASYQIGESVPVVYDPDAPDNVYLDSFYGLWATPIYLFVLQIISFVSSLMEPRRRQSEWD